jgi:hypothetical protein
VSNQATSAAERFQTALDLFEFGEAMVRQRLRRENPDLSSDQVEARLEEWLLSRPGAEASDAVGRPGRWPRKRAP